MAGHDRPSNVVHDVEFADEATFKEDMAKHPAPSTPALEVAASCNDAGMVIDPGLAAPVTPVDMSQSSERTSPRHSQLWVTRMKLRRDTKKQRINAHLTECPHDQKRQVWK